MSKVEWVRGTPQTIANCIRKAGFLGENVENMCDEEITVKTVAVNNRDDVRQGVNILFDLEVRGYLSDSDILSSVTIVTSSQSSDGEEEQKMH